MRIVTRLAAVTAIITLLALGSATLLWNATLQNERRDELNDRLLDQARVLAALLPPPEAGRPTISALVNTMHRETRSRLTVIAADGTVLAESELDSVRTAAMENHAGRPEVMAALEGGIGRTSRKSPTLGIPMAYVAVRWGPSSQPYGVVRAALPMTRVVEEQRRSRGRLALVVLVSFLLAGFLGTMAARRISGPLRRMSEAARRIARGDLSQRLEVTGSREAKELAHAVNHLADSVQVEIGALDRERRRLAQLLEGMPDGILALDRDGRITLVNQSAQEVLGITGEYLGKTPVEVVRSGELQEAVDQALESGASTTLEVTLTDPIRRTLSVSLVPLTAGLVVVIHDVTRLRRLESARREMVSNIGHELRTPLSAILGYLETLEQDDTLTLEERRRFMDIVMRNSRRLERLVRDLSRLSRFESTTWTRDQVPMDLSEVVRAGVETLGPRAAERRVRIEASVAENLPWVQGDRDALDTIVLNLLDNAVRVSPEGGTVRISLELRDGELQLAVQDEGPGVPRDLRERVFERFYRIDPGRSSDRGGSGLGLAIVKHAAMQHGGRVWVEDRPQGGARFLCALPAIPIPARS